MFFIIGILLLINVLMNYSKTTQRPKNQFKAWFLRKKEKKGKKFLLHQRGWSAQDGSCKRSGRTKESGWPRKQIAPKPETRPVGVFAMDDGLGKRKSIGFIAVLSCFPETDCAIALGGRLSERAVISVKFNSKNTFLMNGYQLTNHHPEDGECHQQFDGTWSRKAKHTKP